MQKISSWYKTKVSSKMKISGPFSAWGGGITDDFIWKIKASRSRGGDQSQGTLWNDILEPEMEGTNQ